MTHDINKAHAKKKRKKKKKRIGPRSPKITTKYLQDRSNQCRNAKKEKP